jgi:hypothetical protein
MREHLAGHDSTESKILESQANPRLTMSLRRSISQLGSSFELPRDAGEDATPAWLSGTREYTALDCCVLQMKDVYGEQREKLMKDKQARKQDRKDRIEQVGPWLEDQDVVSMLGGGDQARDLKCSKHLTLRGHHVSALVRNIFQK